MIWRSAVAESTGADQGDLPRIYQGQINTGGATLADARGAEGLRRLGTAGRQQDQIAAPVSYTHLTLPTTD